MVACLPRRRAVPSASRLIAPYARSDRELRPGWTAGGFLTVEPDESWRFLHKVGEQRIALVIQRKDTLPDHI